MSWFCARTRLQPGLVFPSKLLLWALEGIRLICSESHGKDWANGPNHGTYIRYGSSEHITHAWIKLCLFGGKTTICDCSSNEMPYIYQETDIAPYLRTDVWVTNIRTMFQRHCKNVYTLLFRELVLIIQRQLRLKTCEK